jgi:hypothetical protein
MNWWALLLLLTMSAALGEAQAFVVGAKLPPAKTFTRDAKGRLVEQKSPRKPGATPKALQGAKKPAGTRSKPGQTPKPPRPVRGK